MISNLEEELECAPLEGEFESDLKTGRVGRLIRRAYPTLRKLGIISRIVSLIAQPPHDPVLPVEPPQIMIIDKKRKKRKKNKDEFAAEISRNTSSVLAPMMEHFAHAAAVAESEAEAAAFISALVPAAAKLVPRAANDVMSAAPQLILGLSRSSSLLRKRPETRPLVRIIPAALRSTLAALARQSSAGRVVTPRAITAGLARQMAQVLSDPGLTMLALRRSQLWDREYHDLLS